MKKQFRKALVFFGYQPWIRCCQVAAWNREDGRASVMYCTRDGYKELYVDHGLKCQEALEFETKRITNKKFIIMERSKLPATKEKRDDWTVNYNRNTIEVK